MTYGTTTTLWNFNLGGREPDLESENVGSKIMGLLHFMGKPLNFPVPAFSFVTKIPQGSAVRTEYIFRLYRTIKYSVYFIYYCPMSTEQIVSKNKVQQSSIKGPGKEEARPHSQIQTTASKGVN